MMADLRGAEPTREARGEDPATPFAAPLVLAIEAATYVGSAAVLRGTRVLAERTVAMRGEREERLMPAVGDVLAEACVTPRQLDVVACGGGPGSFTSLRIAGAIAKGIATAAGRPLVAVPSLALAAARPAVQPAAERVPGRWLVVLDAMRGERYAAVVTLAVGPARLHVVGYDYLGVVVEGELRALAERHAVLGTVDAGAEPPTAAAVAAFAVGGAPATMSSGALEPLAVDLALWEPDYGRKAEAQVKWELQHGRSLPADASGVTTAAAAHAAPNAAPPAAVTRGHG
jgi:tRNA threonylcarbamoyladenosine biosynthesis protein TsaB